MGALLLLATLGAAAALWLVASDSAPGPDVYLAALFDVGTDGLGTGVVFPHQYASSRLLLRGWVPARGPDGEVLRVEGTTARLGFVSVADTPPVFVFEARPLEQPGTPQGVSVRLNDVEIAARELPPGWRSYKIELPDELVNVGWNEIELRFAYSTTLAIVEPAGDGSRTAAAEFRLIEMRAATPPRAWPDRPEVVSRTADPFALSSAATAAKAPAAATTSGAGDASTMQARDFSTASIDMPADSFFEAYITPQPGARIGGAVVAEFVAGDTAAAPPGDIPPAGSGLAGSGTVVAASTLRAIIDVVEPDRIVRLWEAQLTPGEMTAEVDADLAAWAGDVIGLRLRVLGGASGIVRWRGVHTTLPSPPHVELWASPGEATSPPSSARLGRPDVFLIMLDAARADVFEGSLGAEVAPSVQALAAEGTWFSRAWGPSSWTGQSAPALLTGRFADAIGIEHWGSTLPPGITTFPQLLREAGYRTALWSQHIMYRSRPALLSGFDVFEEPVNPDPTDHAGDTQYPNTVEILPALAELVAADRPTFAMIHLISPHDPYLPPPPFGGSRSAWYTRDIPITGRLLNRFDVRFGNESEQLRDEIRRAAISMYRENVSFADHQVGLLLQQLRDMGRYDDALIIVVSDHGEAFYEHGRFLHTNHVYEEFVRVPFAVKWPRSLAAFAPLIETPVSLVDIAPTLIDGLGAGARDGRARYQGRSLLPLAAGEPIPSRVLYTYTSGQFDPERPARPEYAVVWNDMKLLYNLRDDRTSLYRLSEDPGETVDVSLRAPYYAHWLAQALRTFRSQNADLLLGAGGARINDLDAEMVRMLRALGYLRQ